MISLPNWNWNISDWRTQLLCLIRSLRGCSKSSLLHTEYHLSDWSFDSSHSSGVWLGVKGIQQVQPPSHWVSLVWLIITLLTGKTRKLAFAMIITVSYHYPHAIVVYTCLLCYPSVNALICLHRSSRDGRNNNSCYSTCQVSSLLIFLKAITFLSLNVVLFISILSLILFVWKLSTKNVSLNK